MAIAEKSEAVNPIYVNIYIYIYMVFKQGNDNYYDDDDDDDAGFLGYPIPKRDMLQSRLVHGQRLGTGEVGTGYIVVNGPSEHGMFKIIYIYIKQWVPAGLYIDDSFGIYDDICLFYSVFTYVHT